ncbi:unnamed protein product [Boreogadus saida]
MTRQPPRPSKGSQLLQHRRPSRIHPSRKLWWKKELRGDKPQRRAWSGVTSTSRSQGSLVTFVQAQQVMFLNANLK